MAACMCVTAALNQRARMAMEERFVLMHSATLILLILSLDIDNPRGEAVRPEPGKLKQHRVSTKTELSRIEPQSLQAGKECVCVCMREYCLHKTLKSRHVELEGILISFTETRAERSKKGRSGVTGTKQGTESNRSRTENQENSGSQLVEARDSCSRVQRAREQIKQEF